MYAMLVLKHGLDPEYVLDKMEMYEAGALLRYQHYTNSEDWEQARLIAYMTAQVNSKNRLEVTDIIEFPWEKERKSEDNRMTKEQLQHLREEAQNIIKQKQQQ